MKMQLIKIRTNWYFAEKLNLKNYYDHIALMIYKKSSIWTFVLIVLLFNNCLNRRFIKGYPDLIGVRDSTLNDSSIVTGFVYQYFESIQSKQAIEEAEIQIEKSLYFTQSNEMGEYLLKTAPGIFTISCKRKNEEWPQLHDRIEGIDLEMSTIMRLDFYLGYTEE